MSNLINNCRCGCIRFVGVRIFSNVGLSCSRTDLARKYRNEPRPRQGLLRAREFVMKDLYTFDSTPELAMQTYQRVRDVYSQLFDNFKIPYLVAEASSGDIGGSISHEYHLPSEAGEDQVASCNKCNYVANVEVAESRMNISKSIISHNSSSVWKDLPLGVRLKANRLK